MDPKEEERLVLEREEKLILRKGDTGPKGEERLILKDQCETDPQGEERVILKEQID
jgi:hypothetical protein